MESSNSPNDRPKAPPRKPPTDLYIGIDFGTTYSGVAWTDGILDLDVISDWPSKRIRTEASFKVPTQITYDPKGSIQRWGYPEVGSKHGAKREPILEWFKPLLEEWSSHAFYEDYISCPQVMNFKQNCPSGKKASDVAADYLHELWEHTFTDISERLGIANKNQIKTDKLHVVLGVPAVWSVTAKNRMLKVARAAGLPNDVQLICEPEATALAVMQKSNLKFSKDSALIICDAGGGTVDVISYLIKSQTPLQMRELVQGDGGMCGSIKLNIAFEQYIGGLVGTRNYKKINEIHKRGLRDQFERFIKPEFSLDDNPEADKVVGLEGVPDNRSARILDGSILVSNSELASIFQSTGDDIRLLVEEQIKGVREVGGIQSDIPINVVLTGGFGDSQYLYDLLKKEFSKGSVSVIRQKSIGWRAVALGAALRALESPASDSSSSEFSFFRDEAYASSVVTSISGSDAQDNSTSRSRQETPFIQSIESGSIQSVIARYSYGIRRRVPPSDGSHQIGDNEILWIVKEGTTIGSIFRWSRMFKTTVKKGFIKRGVWSDEIVYQSSEDETPQVLRPMEWNYLTRSESFKLKNVMPKIVGSPREFADQEIYLPQN